jgi:hypothetical protein
VKRISVLGNEEARKTFLIVCIGAGHMAEDHKTVLLSIMATIVAGLFMFIGTVVVSGGISIDLIKGYVLPLFISAFTLAVFAGVLYARNKGRIPWLGPVEPAKQMKEEPPTPPQTKE